MDFSGYFYNDRGQPLNLVKVEAFNPATDASLAVVYTNTSGYWVFTGLTVVPKIQIYFPFNYVVVQDARQEQLRSQRAQADGYPSLDSAGKVPIAQLPTAAPTASIDIGDAAAEGTATSVPRVDHQHSFPAPAVAPTKVSTAPDAGTSTTPARNDHVHDMGIITTLGDLLYQAVGSATRLPGNTTTTRKFLRQVGDGALSAAPAWDTLVTGDIPATLTPGTLNLPYGVDPLPNTEGQIYWDSDDNRLVVGDGVGPRYIVPTASVSGEATMTAAGVVTVAGAHSGSAHSAYIPHSLATALDDMLMASGVGVFIKKTLAEVKTALAIAADIATHAALPNVHHAQTHGAAEHTDRTRSIWLPATVFGPGTNAPTEGKFGPANAEGALLVFLGDGGLHTSGLAWELPGDYVAGSAITFYIVWAADTDTNTANNCRWYVRYTSLADGESIDAAADDALLGLTVAVPSATARTRKKSLVGSSSAGLVAGETIRLVIVRADNEASDTMTGSALLLGVLVEYTADM